MGPASEQRVLPHPHLHIALSTSTGDGAHGQTSRARISRTFPKVAYFTICGPWSLTGCFCSAPVEHASVLGSVVSLVSIPMSWKEREASERGDSSTLGQMDLNEQSEADGMHILTIHDMVLRRVFRPPPVWETMMRLFSSQNIYSSKLNGRAALLE